MVLSLHACRASRVFRAPQGHQLCFSSSSPSCAAATRHIYATEGIPGFFRGMSALLATYLPTSVAWWVTYEWAKDQLVSRFGAAAAAEGRRSSLDHPNVAVAACAASPNEHNGGQQGSDGASSLSGDTQLPVVHESFLHCIAGGAAGFAAAVVSNPFCLATTRLQTQHTITEAAGEAGAALDRTLMQSMRSIIVVRAVCGPVW